MREAASEPSDRVLAKRVRRRMLPHDREQMIVAEATRYFAEYGLSAGMTELANRVGITQPLLYKYFPTKDDLIERVYTELLDGRWNSEWERLLDDSSTPLVDRLKRFYVEFYETVFTYEHVRLFLFSGLGKYDFNRRYYNAITARIFTRIVQALRLEAGPTALSGPITDAEMELVQSLHAAIYHIAFRRWVHGPEPKRDTPELIEMKIDFFLEGAGQTVAKLAKA